MHKKPVLRSLGSSPTKKIQEKRNDKHYEFSEKHLRRNIEQLCLQVYGRTKVPEESQESGKGDIKRIEQFLVHMKPDIRDILFKKEPIVTVKPRSKSPIPVYSQAEFAKRLDQLNNSVKFALDNSRFLESDIGKAENDMSESLDSMKKEYLSKIGNLSHEYENNLKEIIEKKDHLIQYMDDLKRQVFEEKKEIFCIEDRIAKIRNNQKVIEEEIIVNLQLIKGKQIDDYELSMEGGRLLHEKGRISKKIDSFPKEDPIPVVEKIDSTSTYSDPEYILTENSIKDARIERQSLYSKLSYIQRSLQKKKKKISSYERYFKELSDYQQKIQKLKTNMLKLAPYRKG